MNARAIDLAYAAGIIDGEGCVSICDASFYGREVYQLRVAVQMTNPEAIRVLYELFGGRLYYVLKTEKRKARDSWMVFNSQAATTLRELMPYLKVKQYIALAALRADWPKPHGRGLSIGQQEIRREVFAILKDLNMRGPR